MTKQSKKQYFIQCHYEVWSRKGKKWTKWFKTGGIFDDKEKVIEEIERMKKAVASIDRITKLSHEYKYVRATETNE